MNTYRFKIRYDNFPVNGFYIFYIMADNLTDAETIFGMIQRFNGSTYTVELI